VAIKEPTPQDLQTTIDQLRDVLGQLLSAGLASLPSREHITVVCAGLKARRVGIRFTVIVGGPVLRIACDLLGEDGEETLFELEGCALPPRSSPSSSSAQA
jgi:hypothetical protein